MSTQLDTLKRHQQWRRGSDEQMIDPHEVGEAIDYAIAVCEAASNLVKVKGRHHSERAYLQLIGAVQGIAK